MAAIVPTTIELQWGLGLSTEESLLSRMVVLHNVVLQWGLGLSTEERHKLA